MALRNLDGPLQSTSKNELQVVLLVRTGTARLLLSSMVTFLLTNGIWVSICTKLLLQTPADGRQSKGKNGTRCFDTDLPAEGSALTPIASTDKNLLLKECCFTIDSSKDQKVDIQSIRIELLENAKDPWEVHEIWLRRVALQRTCLNLNKK